MWNLNFPHRFPPSIQTRRPQFVSRQVLGMNFKWHCSSLLLPCTCQSWSLPLCLYILRQDHWHGQSRDRGNESPDDPELSRIADPPLSLLLFPVLMLRPVWIGLEMTNNKPTIFDGMILYKHTASHVFNGCENALSLKKHWMVGQKEILLSCKGMFAGYLGI